MKKIVSLLIVSIITLIFISGKPNYTGLFLSNYSQKNSYENNSFLDPTICGVNFVSPWFEIKDSTGTDLIIVDNNGNFYINSSSIVTGQNPVDTGWNNSFMVRKGTDVLWVFTKSQSIINGSIIQSSTLTYDSNDFVIRNSTTLLAVFDGATGNIYVRGIPVYQGSQAGCPTDGYTCNGDIKEYRDYYCSATNGSCIFRVTSSTICSASDYYYCSGDVRMLKDYYCSNGWCVSTDRTIENCNNYDGWYCASGTTREYRNYYCSSGVCTYSVTSSEDCFDVYNCEACTGYGYLYCYRCSNNVCDETCSSYPLSGYTCTYIC